MQKTSKEKRSISCDEQPRCNPAYKPALLKYGFAALISLLTFIIYLPSLQNDFVHWDDNLNVYDNTFIRSFDLNFLKRAFLELSAVDYWRPLTWLSHALDYAVWGLDPLGHHLTNNILHAVNTFVVVLLVVKLMEARNSVSTLNSPLPPLSLRGGAEGGGVISDKPTLITAAATGLLFGLHPVHVESVAWVSERKDILCALFFLLSVIIYMQYLTPSSPSYVKRVGQNRRCYLLSLLFFTLALMSKPMAVTLPAVLLILDWYPFNRLQSPGSFRPVFIEKLPFIALSIISSVMTILAQKTVGATEAIGSIPLATRIPVAARAIILYLWKMLLPVNLVPYYSYPKNVSLMSPEYFMPVILIIGITVSCLLAVRRNRLLLSCWVYYLITLLPVIGIIQVGHQSMADRYLYLPGLGLFLVIGVAAGWLLRSAGALNKFGLRFKLICTVAVIASALMSYITINQISIWKNSMSLWTFVIEKEPSSDFAYVNRGAAFNDSGQFDKAIEDFNKAMAINPSYFMAYYNRGLTFTNMGLLDLAIQDLNKSILLEPAAAAAYYARGMVFEKKRQLEMAVADFEQAIAVNPSYDSAYLRLGVLYGKAGLIDKAIGYLDKAIDLGPNNFLAYSNRGFAYSLLGQYDKALKDLDKAVELNSGYPGVYGDRGNVYLKTGRKGLAARDFQKACSMGDQEACRVMPSLQP